MKNSVTAAKPEETTLAEPDVSTIPQPQRKPWILFGIIGAVAVLTLLLGTALALWVFRSDDRPNTFGQFAVNLLLGNKSVQEELKVSGEQMEKVAKLEEDRRKNMPTRNNNRGVSPADQRIKGYQQSRAMETELGKILDKDQMTRLRQIALQVRVKREPDLVKILFEDEIAPALNLTQQQKEELQSLEQQFARGQGGRGQGGRGQGGQGGRGQGGQGGRGQGGQGGQAANMDDAQKEAAQKAAEERRQQAEEARKAQSDQILAVLTAEQQKTWQGILGTPFTGEISNPQGGRAGGRRAPGGQN